MLYFVLAITIGHSSYVAYHRLGLTAAVTVLAGGVGFTVAFGVLGALLAAWVGYFGGLGPDKNLSRWQIVLGLFLMPFGMFGVPMLRRLPVRVVAPLMPPPAAAELRG